MPSYLTIGTIAKHFSRPEWPIPPWKIRRLIERGLLAEPPRVGVYRVFVPADLPRIEAALRQAKYLPQLETATA